MNATNHMNALMTGSSQATQLLALLNGQGSGQAAGLTGAPGKTGEAAKGGQAGGDFAMFLQALVSAKGGKAPAADLTKGGSDGGKPATPTLGALLNTFKNAQAEADADTNGGNPLQALMSALKDAGIDLDALREMLAGQRSGDGGSSGDALAGLLNGEGASDESVSEESPADPLMALVALLAGQASAQDQPGAQAGGKEPAALTSHDAGKAESASTPPAANAQTRQSVEDFLASLSPQDRARIADALRQLQAADTQTSAQPQTAQTQAVTETTPQMVVPPDVGKQAEKSGGAQTINNAGTTRPETAQETQPPLARQAATGKQSAGPVESAAAPSTPAATAGKADAAPDGRGAQHQQTAQAQANAQGQSEARAQAHTATPASNNPQTDAAARTISQHMPEHVAREVSLQVSQGQRAAGGSGGQPLLSAGTAASAMNAMSASQSAGVAEAATNLASQVGQSGTSAQTATSGQAPQAAAATTTDGFLGLMSGLDQRSLTDPSGREGAFDGLDGISRPGGLEQLDSSVVKMARTPMTHQAAPSQVALHMSKAAEQGTNRFVIQLSPASLGEVDVEMNVAKDGSVQATLRVEKPETLQMLQRDQGLLQQALQDAGLKPDSGSLNFSLKQQGGQLAGDGGGNAPGHGGAAGGEADGVLADADAQPARSSHNGQLDVTI